MPRINEESIPRKNFEIVSTWKNKKRSSQNPWINERITRIRVGGLDSKKWIDRKEWRRKIKFWTQKDV